MFKKFVVKKNQKKERKYYLPQKTGRATFIFVKLTWEGQN